MISEKIDVLISNAIKEKDSRKLAILRLIKTELVNAVKNNITLTDDKEIDILLKMVAQREDSAKTYESANRFDLAEQELYEATMIKTYLPKIATDDEINEETKKVIDGLLKTKKEVTLKDMSTIITSVRMAYPTANKKVISNIVKTLINNK